MKHGIQYVVTKEGDDGTFVVGDRLRLYSNGDIGCIDAEGWIDKEDVDSALKGAEFEIDPHWADWRRKKLLEELANLESK